MKTELLQPFLLSPHPQVKEQAKQIIAKLESDESADVRDACFELVQTNVAMLTLDVQQLKEKHDDLISEWKHEVDLVTYGSKGGDV